MNILAMTTMIMMMMITTNQNSHASWKTLEFFPLIFSGSGKSWKLKLEALESPGKLKILND